MTTIKDVAERAGVSRSSVSRFLNGHEVRERDAIAAAIRELNYEPSPIARSLKSGRTRSIGVVVPDITNPYFAAVFTGIEAASQPADGEEGFQLFLCNTEESTERLEEVLAGLSGRVDGLVVIPPAEVVPPREVRRLRVPFVLVDREFAGQPIADSVLIDNPGGVQAAVHHLVHLGHRRIGFVSGPVDTTPGRGRYEGYVAALNAAGLPYDEALVRFGDFQEEGGRTATTSLLTLAEPPTAIVAANNLMSLGALRGLAEAHVELPHDLSFIGFDDFEAATLIRPAVTTVSRPMTAQGAEAMRLLLERMRGKERPPERVVLRTWLTVRESCGPPPTHSSRRG